MSGTIANNYSNNRAVEVINVFLGAIRDPKGFFTFRSRHETENKISYVARAIFETLAKVVFVSLVGTGMLASMIFVGLSFVLLAIPSIGVVAFRQFGLKETKIEQSVNIEPAASDSRSTQPDSILPTGANVIIES